ncbi:MAG TPA: hypothetical protein VG164_01645 [Trebonia sp.]|nr:hypothetical protein [Trebonia sp.]
MDVAGARRKAYLAVATGVVVLAVIGFAVFELTGHVTNAATSPGRAPGAPAPASAPAPAAPTSTSIAPVVPTTSTSHPVASPAASATTSPPLAGLRAVAAVAFGPTGTGDGDNPQLAGNVLTDPGAGWMSDWYTTDLFGELKRGTGLLLDMGRAVSLGKVSVDLGTASGTSLQLRAGAQPAPGALPVLASAADAGARVSFPLAKPVTARYVLLWFTKLPPDGSGTYQAAVHGVTIAGRP